MLPGPNEACAREHRPPIHLHYKTIFVGQLVQWFSCSSREIVQDPMRVLVTMSVSQILPPKLFLIFYLFIFADHFPCPKNEPTFASSSYDLRINCPEKAIITYRPYSRENPWIHDSKNKLVRANDRNFRPIDKLTSSYFFLCTRSCPLTFTELFFLFLVLFFVWLSCLASILLLNHVRRCRRLKDLLSHLFPAREPRKKLALNRNQPRALHQTNKKNNLRK